MNYEVVELEEKVVVGISSRTKNSDPQMGMIIGGLWNDFYQKGIYQSISHKSNEKALGLYTNYESDLNGPYDIVVACEVNSSDDQLEELKKIIIPAGKYAKFVVRGQMQKAVGDFWYMLSDESIDRAYSCDYEEYQNSDMEDAEIHMYISIK